MTEDLSNKKCVPCEGGIPPFTIDQINTYQKKVDNWDVKEDIKDQYYLIKNVISVNVYKHNLPTYEKKPSFFLLYLFSRFHWVLVPHHCLS